MPDLRAASSGSTVTQQNSIATTLPAGTAAGDIVFVAGGQRNTGATTLTATATQGAWTTHNAGEQTGDPSGAAYGIFSRILASGDTAPTINSSDTGRWAWAAIAIRPDAGGTLSIDGTPAFTLDTTGAATSQPPADTAANAGELSVLIQQLNAAVNGATAVDTTPPTNWTEPASGDASTASGTTTGARQIAASVSYRLNQGPGSVAPGTLSTNVNAIAAMLHALVIETGGGGDATVTPAVIATAAALPSSARNVGAGPAAVATTTSLPASNRNVAAGPSAIATAAALVRPAVNVGAAPTVVPTTVALPTPTAGQSGSGATATPAAVATLAALPRPDVNVGAGPATTAAVTALPQAAPSGVANTSPATIATAVALTRAALNVTAGPVAIPLSVSMTRSNVNVAAGPAVVPALVAVVRPSVNVGAGPAVALMVASLPQAVSLAGGNVTAVPATIAVAVTVPQSAPSAGSTVTPAAIGAAIDLARAAVNVAATTTTIGGITALPLATVTTVTSATPATIAVLAALAASRLNVSASPAAIAVIVAMPTPTAGLINIRDVTFVAGPPRLGYSAGAVGIRLRGGSPHSAGYGTVDDGFGEGPFGDAPFGG